MIDRNDPAMNEIVVTFCSETENLLLALQNLLNLLEKDMSQIVLLENFGQIIDRIMGAAKSISATEIATICELGKEIGYKSSQTNDPQLIEIVVAVFFDTIELLSKLNADLKNNTFSKSNFEKTQTFITRLKWLSEKFKHVKRSSCDFDSNKLNQETTDQLLKKLGV